MAELDNPRPRLDGAGWGRYCLGVCGHCELCGRQVSELTRHHLVPRTLHHNRRVRRDRGRAGLKAAMAWLCRPCHGYVHALFEEKTLEREFSTLAALSAEQDVARFLAWIRTKPDGFRPGTRNSRQKR